ncbi:hypothetical protein LO763_12560 [Glycomyces sp. A-F 0318]|nr:hypothetical protein [Glycomyces amatae]MCD0444451.1 hypothetical protein [Glycomyces amatae]
MGVDAAEQVEQAVPLVLGEGPEDPLVDAVEDLVELAQAPRAGFGDRDDVAALVVRVGGAPEVAAFGEFVEDGDEVGLEDAGAVGELRLAGGPGPVERGEDHEVVAVRADRREGVVGDPVDLGGGHAEEPRELALEAGRRVLAAVEPQLVVVFHADSLPPLR